MVLIKSIWRGDSLTWQTLRRLLYFAWCFRKLAAVVRGIYVARRADAKEISVPPARGLYASHRADEIEIGFCAANGAFAYILGSVFVFACRQLFGISGLINPTLLIS